MNKKLTKICIPQCLTIIFITNYKKAHFKIIFIFKNLKGVRNKFFISFRQHSCLIVISLVLFLYFLASLCCAYFSHYKNKMQMWLWMCLLRNKRNWIMTHAHQILNNFFLIYFFLKRIFLSRVSNIKKKKKVKRRLCGCKNNGTNTKVKTESVGCDPNAPHSTTLPTC